MAFTEEWLPVSKQRYFTFNVSAGNAAAAYNSQMSENFSPSFAYLLDTIRLGLSTVHASVVDFVAVANHHSGSAYNIVLVSQAMNGVDTVLYQADPHLFFHSGTTLHFSMIMSAANNFGLTVTGWAITQSPRG